jgi:hypothetical protein
MLRRRAINLNLDSYINFADPVVAEMCINAWGDGTGLTRRQAMFVTNAQFEQVFNGTETGITSFDEMRFFSSLTRVPANAFKNCTGLTSVMIPSSVTDIRDNAFSGCSSLASINLVNVKTIRYNAFKECSSLSVELELPNLTSLPYDSFRDSGITKIKSLGTITSMGNYGNFMGCTSLTNVVLPETLTSMNRQQFHGCTNLETVIIYATTPPSVTSQNFRDCGNAIIYVPYSADHSILTAYQTVWGNNSGANQYDVPRLAELDENGNIPE